MSKPYKHPKRKIGKLPGDWKDRPILSMTVEEQRAYWAESGLGSNFQFLQDARNNVDQELILAVAELQLPDGSKRKVICDIENGDNEGFRFVGNVVQDIRHYPGLLLPGERITLQRYRVVEWTSEEMPIPEDD